MNVLFFGLGLLLIDTTIMVLVNRWARNKMMESGLDGNRK